MAHCACLTTTLALLFAAVEARQLLASYPCTSGDSACFCAWKGSAGIYADVDAACQKYYQCVSATQSHYHTCPPTLLYDDKQQGCEWPANVQCDTVDPRTALARLTAKHRRPAASHSPAASKHPSPATKRPSLTSRRASPAAKRPSAAAKHPPPPSPRPPPPRHTPSPSPSKPPPARPPPKLSTSPPPRSQPPPPAPAPASGEDASYPCSSGDAACFCNWKMATGMFADAKAGCKSYYWCVSSAQTYYQSCGTGLLFSDAQQYCDWAADVQCTPPPPGPPPPPSPPPSAPPPPLLAPPPLPPSPPTVPAPPGANFKYVGYYQSWSDPWSGAAATSALANLPPYVTHVILSFMQPDASYGGGVTWAGTGLQFSSDPAIVKAAIASLRTKNPGTKVLVAVGGSTYTNFTQLNASAVATFVSAFGLDGVDIDYEPGSPACAVNGTTALVSCATDAEYIASVRALRAALPHPLLLSAATWSIGAYGEGAFGSAQPQGQYTGVALNMLRAAGSQLDLLNLMSYDAGTTYNATQALDAYRSYFAGDVVVGVEVANEAWGGHVVTLAEVDALAEYVVATQAAGMMLWSLQKPADQGPTAEQISQAACAKLGLPSCSCGLSCSAGR